MTKKPLIAGLASVATMAAVLWTMPAAAGKGSAAYIAHDKWSSHLKQADAGDMSQSDDMNGPDGDHDCVVTVGPGGDSPRAQPRGHQDSKGGFALKN